MEGDLLRGLIMHDPFGYGQPVKGVLGQRLGRRLHPAVPNDPPDVVKCTVAMLTGEGDFRPPAR